MEVAFKGGVTAEMSKVYLRSSFDGVLEGSLVAYSEDQLLQFRARMDRDLDGRGHPGYCLFEPQKGSVLPKEHVTFLFVKDGRFDRQHLDGCRFDKLLLVVDLFVHRIDPDISLGALLKSVTGSIDFGAYACAIDYQNDFKRACRLEEGLEDISRYPEWL